MKYLDISGLHFQLADTEDQQKFSALCKCLVAYVKRVISYLLHQVTNTISEIDQYVLQGLLFLCHMISYLHCEMK